MLGYVIYENVLLYILWGVKNLWVCIKEDGLMYILEIYGFIFDEFGCRYFVLKWGVIIFNLKIFNLEIYLY